MPVEKERILIIDDEAVLRDACKRALLKKGYLIETAENGEVGLNLVRDFNPDLVLIDLKMPGRSGMDVLEELERTCPDIVKVVITGYSTVALAVEAMKKGAHDFMPKPFTPEEIRLTVDRGLEKRRLILEREALRKAQETIRRNMISLVSHEMRAPLAATIQYLEVILGGMAGEVSQESLDIIRQCNNRLREMLDLFSRWLKLATFDPQRTAEHFNPVSLPELVAKAMDLLKAEAESRNIEMVLESPENLPPFSGSKGALEEIFNNLLSNAIKYNKAGGWVKVRLSSRDEEISAEVSDGGAGIPEEHLPRIFDEFYRVDGRRNAPIKGAGLGLAIVQKLVETHGGSVDVESRFGEGTTFRVTFPLSTEEAVH